MEKKCVLHNNGLFTYVKSLCSFELLFVLWLFSYQYKNAFKIFSSPDITVLLTFILIPWAVILYLKEKAKPKFNDGAVLAFLGLSLWFIISSFWSPSEFYKTQKTLCFALYTIPGFFMGYMIISQSTERLKRLMVVFFAFGVVILCETYHIFVVNGLGFISDVLNTNYLVTGQTLGVGLIILFTYSYFALNKPISLYAYMFLCGLFVYALINIGGRGPVIAAGCAVAIFYAARSWLDSFAKTGMHLGIFFTFCILTYFALNELLGHTGSHFQQRLVTILSGHIDESVNERLIYYKSAILTFLQHPIIGVGFGGWPVVSGLGDISIHPHNIFLEVLSETGVIGFTLFLSLLYFTFRRLTCSFIFLTPEYTSLFLLTVFSFINAQKTGDLHDNLLLFITFSLWVGINSKMYMLQKNCNVKTLQP